MHGDEPTDITNLLLAWSQGDRTALDRLTPLVYNQLRYLARRYMRSEVPDHTLQPTALAHEAYIRLVNQDRVNWRNRAHFFGVAAQVIRRLLIDYARERQRIKRGGGAVMVSWSERIAVPEAKNLDVVALDDALTRLADLDPQQSRIVELRFFAGLSIKETAEALNISPATVKRDWMIARAWLYQQLKSSRKVTPPSMVESPPQKTGVQK
jgi:RNA polymerase sigma factor (TIGR02999 family)